MVHCGGGGGSSEASANGERDRRLSRDLHPGLRLRAPQPHHRKGSESAGCRLVPCEFFSVADGVQEANCGDCSVRGEGVRGDGENCALGCSQCGPGRHGDRAECKSRELWDEEMVWGAECVVSVYVGRQISTLGLVTHPLASSSWGAPSFLPQRGCSLGCP